ncbi:MAG: beta-galactosidase [Candidatus Marinimicrobia bacterium]|nr:beta-galactosidase [Candidatus Neomarinimicrobiota bacterium]MCF7880134.1 beta-galactosidase [Candidatus Neomarinimicrobiota bacterium]
MRDLLKGETYIPFGSQYYRAPSPKREDWDRDLAKMADLGFNMVKFWVQWRWNHPEENRYDFSDIDELMELSRKHNLKVMLNTIFDIAPAWIYKKFPDASMITLGGKEIGPQSQPHRQIGGLGYCYNHDGIMEHFFHFLEETVKRYKDHPALDIWNVGSEPELTSSMSEMRLWADDADRIDEMLCYCDNCQRKFPQWLREKYGDIGSLNNSWNRNYQSFDEVEVPKTRNTINDITDWRMFFVHSLGENVRRRFEVAQEVDQGAHPLMCHHVFIQGFPVTSTASDPWNVGQYGDLHGFTQRDDTAMIDILRSCARDKPVISAEMLMLPGYTLDMPEPIDENDIKRFIFSGVAGNLKGFINWQYRPEILGRETPTWGLTTLDGGETERLKAFAECGDVLQSNADFLLDATPRPADIAMLYSPENQVFAWMATGNEKTATDSLLGTHKALYEHNYNMDFIHPKEFTEHLLSQYKVLYIPFPYRLNEDMATIIKEWVHSGGVLIGEAYFGGWNSENGHHNTVVPGYGLHEVFQVRQLDALPIHGSDTEVIEPNSNIFGGKEKIKASIVKEVLTLEGAEVLAKFDTGDPAVTQAEYGAGKAILIGSYIGLPYQRTGFKPNRDFIGALVSSTIEIARPSVDTDKRIRVDMLTHQDEQLVILQNLEQEAVHATVTIPDLQADSLTEQFSGKTLELNTDDTGISVEMDFQPGEVQVYRA